MIRYLLVGLLILACDIYITSRAHSTGGYLFGGSGSGATSWITIGGARGDDGPSTFRDIEPSVPEYFELNEPLDIDIISPLYSPWHKETTTEGSIIIQ